MALSIHDREAEKLAADIAALTGETQTEAVKRALQDRLDLIKRQTPEGKASIEELLSIANSVAAHVKRPYVGHGELFYDEHGLPKWIVDTSALAARRARSHAVYSTDP